MRYPQSIAESAEILRLVLPRIAQHGGRYVPTDYCVWYEHLAGVNPPLSQALESHLQDSKSIESKLIDQLHARHVQQRDEQSTVQMQTGLSELISKLTLLASSSGEDAAEFSRTLQSCEQDLGAIGDSDGLRRVVELLVVATASARRSTDQMRTELSASQQDMESLRQQLGTLQGEALTDPLTGLRNRRGLEQSVAQLSANAIDGLAGTAILIADIDHFKLVNDTFGHLIGDQVIRSCAQVLTGAVKGRDVVARFGGEEFLILLPDTPAKGAMALAEQIRLAVHKLRIQRGEGNDSHPISISIGVALPNAGESMSQVIERADQALYQAKNAGRNCVRLASESLQAKTVKTADPAARQASA